QQPADVEMLACLRHDRFVCGHDEDDEIDAADAGKHVLDEALVAGHVDERDVDIADREVRETEIDRDAAGFLFLQPIRIGTGERLHERALAVIDVTGGADDDRFHLASWLPSPVLPTRTLSLPGTLLSPLLALRRCLAAPRAAVTLPHPLED